MSKELHLFLIKILENATQIFLKVLQIPHVINGKIQPKDLSSNIEKKPIYVIYRRKTPGIYVTFEEVIAQLIEREKDGGISWKKYLDIDQALSYARNILGINYFLEAAAKEYIKKYKKGK